MTPSRETFLALADRVAAAGGADRELDALIWAAIGNVAQRMSVGAVQWVSHAVPKLTASLDAALTLVPEGWDWRLHSIGGQYQAKM